MDNKYYKNMRKFFELKQKEHRFLSSIEDAELVKNIYEIKMKEFGELNNLCNLPIGLRSFKIQNYERRMELYCRDQVVKFHFLLQQEPKDIDDYKELIAYHKELIDIIKFIKNHDDIIYMKNNILHSRFELPLELKKGLNSNDDINSFLDYCDKIEGESQFLIKNYENTINNQSNEILKKFDDFKIFLHGIFDGFNINYEQSSYDSRACYKIYNDEKFSYIKLELTYDKFTVIQNNNGKDINDLKMKNLIITRLFDNIDKIKDYLRDNFGITDKIFLE